MPTEVDLLEQRLLDLGRRELQLEQSIRELLARSRRAATEQTPHLGDEAWNLHREAKATLASLRNRLYSLRRRQRT